ncbi:UDP-glucose/GDP-mannose dehydrogenase family protein [Neobacillus sp. WH10]|uniref:UDP-glucose dehydrogenase family protein n=1 Tax=Neobacillus sp. WH10 TaxID=3047873 RepID=UPI0024C13FDE|nr:UDP-glucose/GDP-mannose dehydrogenase family protein [Neobacillus sp. WH10]WHY78254.1 UDP-glucose/GDP-mannose dehydrogenase family protein [Neobacillus sp. WH10]
MKVTVAGAGFVGLVASACLAELGHQVTCIDIQKEKINMLQCGRSPIYEPGLEELLEKNLCNKQLHFTTSPHQAYSGADIIFIAVGTPENHDGSADLKYIHVVSHTIAHYIEQDVIVCTKSTVPVGTNELIQQIIESRKPPNLQVEVVANPEFLRKGSAIHDFFHGDRIVIGTNHSEAAAFMEQFYLPLKIPIMKTDIRSAEMIKYAANAFLATKISFINEMANICKNVGACIEEVAYGIGQDKRIVHHFLKAGIGYGGSCFPKDTKALIQLSGDFKQRYELLEAVINVNNRQQSLPVLKAKEIIGSLQGKKIALLGLAFKADTDDIRESAAITIIKELLEAGAVVTAYDPIAIPNARRIIGNAIEYTEEIRQALLNADLALIATDWDQIKHLPLEVYLTHMKEPIVIDGRNCYPLQEIRQYPIIYRSIGRPDLPNTNDTFE